MTEDGGAQAGEKICKENHYLLESPEYVGPRYRFLSQPETWASWGFACQVATARWRARHQESAIEIERAEGVQ